MFLVAAKAIDNAVVLGKRLRFYFTPPQTTFTANNVQPDQPLSDHPMPFTFAPFGLVLLAAGREPSGFRDSSIMSPDGSRRFATK